MTPLGFVVPGSLDQLTGGYLFDQRIVSGLRGAGRDVAIGELGGVFPAADAVARASFAAFLAGLPDGAAAAVDGLALAGGEECLPREAERLRLVAFVHHPLAQETGLSDVEAARFAALERRLLPLVRGAICPSAETARALVHYGVAPARVAIVPPGTAKPNPPLARRSDGNGPLRLLCVATVTPRKGHLVLIEALASLGDCDWQLLCLGSVTRDPAAATALSAAIARHHLEGRVTLAGEWPPERLSIAYAAADVFVLPSFHEGYGMAFAEALAHGLPVVGTAAGAIVETVPKDAGILVAPGDAPALASALRQIVSDGELRHRLAAGAARAGAALPDWATTVRRWAAAFDRLVA